MKVFQRDFHPINFVLNEMTSWDVLEVHCNLIRDTLCSVSYISNYGLSISVLFGQELWPLKARIVMSSFTESKVTLAKNSYNILIIVKIVKRNPSSSHSGMPCIFN